MLSLGSRVLVCSFAWAARSCCLMPKCERFSQVLADLHIVAVVCMMQATCCKRCPCSEHS